MRVSRGLHNLTSASGGCVATIGNFDGVHLGHRAVFQRLAAEGRALGLPATVITFEPQPMEFFAPQQAPARLTRLREKLDAMQHDGVDRVVLLPFGARLAAMGAHAFVQELLVDGLGTRFLLVGDDFRFGRGREGDFALLEAMGGKEGLRSRKQAIFPSEACPAFYESAFTWEDIPDRCVPEADGIRLLKIGKIKTFGEGCACPMGGVLRPFLAHFQAGADDRMIVDMAAGVEHFGRSVDAHGDRIIGVIDPSFESFKLACIIMTLAEHSTDFRLIAEL